MAELVNFRMALPPYRMENNRMQNAAVWTVFMFLACCLISHSLRAQNHSYRFEQLTIDDGLSQNLITSIVQDHRGFLWFGTADGLNRYGGYDFKVYKNQPGNGQALADNAVSKLFEDSRGNLWVGAGALHRYNRMKDCFRQVITAGDLSGKKTMLQFQDIKEDHNGDLWIAVQGEGLYHLTFSGKDGAGRETGSSEEEEKGYRLSKPFHFLDDENQEWKQGDVNFLIELNESLWVTHEGGLSRLKASENGAFPEPEEAIFERIIFNDLERGIYYNFLFEGPGASLWIGTSSGLIHIPNPDSPGQYRFFPYPADYFPVEWEGISRKIIADPDGKLWIATYNGVVVFDPQAGAYQLIRNDPDNAKSLSFNNIGDICLDEGGVIWLGTTGMGIDKYLSKGKPFHHYLDKQENKRVYSTYGILADYTGNLWIAANAGELFRFDQNSGEVSAVPPPPSGEWVICHTKKDPKGFFWIVNNHQLVRLDPLTNRMEEYEITGRDPAFYPSDSIAAIHIDYHGEMWLGNTRMLNLFDPETGEMDPFVLPDLNLEKVEALHRDAKGRFWMATLRGLLRYEVNTGEWRLFQAAAGMADSLQHNRLKCLLPDPTDPERFLWIGTGGGGLQRLDMERGVFTVFTEQEGLANNFVYGILPDNTGRLWMSTNRGLSCFDRKSETFTNYGVEDGLQSNEFNSRAVFKSEQGALFFGGINGITAFFPWEIQSNPHVPPVVLTDLQLSYESVRHGTEGAPLTYSITETREVRLSHDQNNIAFEFSALDFSLPRKNRYRYMLEGFDKNWIEVGNERRAPYTNLPPGDYTFRVQGSNNDGIWNTEGAVIRVSIGSPPWKRWWAFGLYFLLAAIGGYTVFRYISDRRKMREELRIKALEAKQLTELDQFKSRFFANVSHEFRTPITLIQGRIEELLGELHRNDQREKLFSMKRGSQQLLRLIEQLLDIARLESSKMKLAKMSGDVVAFLRRLTYSLESAANNKEIHLAFYAAEEHLMTVFDPDALQKIMQNLISNAVKFSSPGGEVRINVEKVRRETPSRQSEWVRIEVTDRGVGISAEDLPNIFERFYQAGYTSASQEKGFGLGLALVKELVTLHGGEIKVQSEEGRWTTFTVDLPLVPPAAAEVETPAPPALNQRLLELEMTELIAPPATGSSLLAGQQGLETVGAKRLLIVEDHPELRRYIAGLFKSEYKVIQAQDGEAGWEAAVEHVPDLIISDVMMPKLDGFEFSERLRNDERTSHIPVILLTAKAESMDRVKGLELGVDDYLVKPFNDRELKTRVDNLIRLRARLKEKYAQSLLAGVAAQGETREEEFLNKVKATIEDQLEDENFGVETLARAVNMSTSQLYRKLTALTGLSSVQLIQRFRLERAAALLKQGRTVTEVAYMVGLRSPAYFSQLFKKHFGCSPKEYDRV